MTKTTFITLSLLLSFLTYSNKKDLKAQSQLTPQKENIPVIDVNKTYPKKELILQDIADVEYIPLETNEASLINGNARIALGEKNTIVVYDSKLGTILFFNKQGKFSHQFNHKGQGAREYIYISNIIVDETNNEIFVIDNSYRKNSIKIYTLKGKYKRASDITKFNVDKLINFNEKSFLFHKDLSLKYYGLKDETRYKPNYIALLNKKENRIDSIIPLPSKMGVTALCYVDGMSAKYYAPEIYLKTPQGIIINDITCDTIFMVDNQLHLLPLIQRTPKVSPKDEPLKMLAIDGISKDNLYVKVVLRKHGMPTTTYKVRKSDHQIIEYTLKNADIEDDKKFADLKAYKLIWVDDLKDLLEEGKLKGKLNKITEKLEEDANPILMKVTLK